MELNVHDSSGTVIFTRGPLSGGSRVTASIARRLGKPWLYIDMTGDLRRVRAVFIAWLVENQITILNVAGSRESKAPGIGEEVTAFIIEALGPAPRQRMRD